MSKIKGADTAPEKIVRSILHRLGLRFSLHKKDLPGKPDIVLPQYNAVIFIHGCFWHRHKNCKEATTPKSRISFWNEKFISNVIRDKKNQRALKNSGWKTLVIWECEIKDPELIVRKLVKFFTT